MRLFPLLLGTCLCLSVSCHSETNYYDDYYFGYQYYDDYYYYYLTTPAPSPPPASFASNSPTPDLTHNPTIISNSGSQYPTHSNSVHNNVLTWEGGTNLVTAGVNHSIAELGQPGNRWLLDVWVYVTDFDDATEYINAIRVNKHVLLSNCNPGVQCGVGYFHCLYSADVTDIIVDGYLNISTTATAAVNICAHLGYHLYVKYELKDSTPSAVTPTPKPTNTLHPTPRPYMVPTPAPFGGIRTLPPTHFGPVDDDASSDIEIFLWEGGTNTPQAGISHVFTALNGREMKGMRWMISVMVYETNFDQEDEFVSAITANKHIIGTHCDPGQACTSRYYHCAGPVDVTAYIKKGMLNVTVLGTSSVAERQSSNATICQHNGKSLYVSYELIGTRLSGVDDDAVDLSASSGDDDGDQNYKTIFFLGIFSGAGVVVCGLFVAAAVIAVMRHRQSGGNRQFQSFAENDMHVPINPSAPPQFIQPDVSMVRVEDASSIGSPLHLSGVLEDPEPAAGLGVMGYGAVTAHEEEYKAGVDAKRGMVSVSPASPVGPVLHSTRKFSCIAINEEQV